LDLPKLRELNCSYNNLTQLVLLHTRNIREIRYHNNIIDYIAPNLQRILNNSAQNIYSDQQNVHNHSIQECIRKSIQNIINIKPIIQNINDSIINDNILTEQCKQILMEYIDDKTVHSTLSITFEELLIHVMSRIEINEHKDEIKNILNTEINDSLCKCYTGRMSRLINCLNGFDELISIHISDSEQIGQIISLIKETLMINDNYSAEKHKEIAILELIKRGYKRDNIETWTQYIE